MFKRQPVGVAHVRLSYPCPTLPLPPIPCVSCATCVQVQQRLIAVELAAGLLATLPDPFAPVPGPAAASAAGIGQANGSGSDVEGMVAAPWGAACLAVLWERSGDKAAGAVRGGNMV